MTAPIVLPPPHRCDCGERCDCGKAYIACQGCSVCWARGEAAVDDEDPWSDGKDIIDDMAEQSERRQQKEEEAA